jgi:pimeloyl-ACP methyl ester carboxylesterase
MPIAAVNDVEIYYEVEGEGEWLLLSHGGDGTHLSWWEQVYFLRNHYKCLSYDMRGLGQSSGTVDYLKADEDLFALMNHLKIERAHLNGHSAGGVAVSRIAINHPERVLSLIMTDTPFAFLTPSLNKWAQGMADRLYANQGLGMASTHEHFSIVDPKGLFLAGTLGRLNERIRPVNPDLAREAYGRLYKDWAVAKPQDYSKFTVPTLFVVGEWDGFTVPWLIRDTAQAVRGAKLAVLRAAGHSPIREQADAYNALILDWLQSEDAKRRDRAWQRPKWSLVDYFHTMSSAA